MRQQRIEAWRRPHRTQLTHGFEVNPMPAIRHRMVFWSVTGLATVILIGIAFVLLATPSVRYRLFGDADSLYAAFAHQICPGASQETVVSVLGPGEPAKDAQNL